MEYPKELGALMIKNMDIIEKAPMVIDEIETKLFRAINNKIEKFVHEKGWIGVFGLVIDDDIKETIFKPKEWPHNEVGHYATWYGLTYARGDHEHWLSIATGVDGVTLALGFSFMNAFFDKPIIAKSKLKELQFKPKISHNKFEFCEVDKQFNSIGLPFLLSSEALAQDYIELDGDFDESLKPLDDALDTLFSVHEVFDAFVKDLKV